MEPHEKLQKTWSLFFLQSPGVGDGDWAAVSTRCNQGLVTESPPCSKLLMSMFWPSLFMYQTAVQSLGDGLEGGIIGRSLEEVFHTSLRRGKRLNVDITKTLSCIKSKGYQTLNVHKSISPLWEGHKSRLLEGSHQPTHQLYWKLFIWPDRHWVIRLWNTPCTTQTVFSFGLIIYCK